MKSCELTPGQLVEFSNSANTRRVRGRFLDLAPDGRYVIQPVKSPDRPITIDPLGAAVKPVTE